MKQVRTSLAQQVVPTSRRGVASGSANLRIGDVAKVQNANRGLAFRGNSRPPCFTRGISRSQSINLLFGELENFCFEEKAV
jgi:hypothetical protein